MTERVRRVRERGEQLRGDARRVTGPTFGRLRRNRNGLATSIGHGGTIGASSARVLTTCLPGHYQCDEVGYHAAPPCNCGHVLGPHAVLQPCAASDPPRHRAGFCGRRALRLVGCDRQTASAWGLDAGVFDDLCPQPPCAAPSLAAVALAVSRADACASDDVHRTTMFSTASRCAASRPPPSAAGAITNSFARFAPRTRSRRMFAVVCMRMQHVVSLTDNRFSV